MPTGFVTNSTAPKLGGCGWGRTNNAFRAEDLQSPGVTNFPTHPKYQLRAAGSTTFNSGLNSTRAPEKLGRATGSRTPL
jgi:hypothetical protein